MNYKAIWSTGELPQLLKISETSTGVAMMIPVPQAEKTADATVPTEEIQDHLDNLTSFIKDKVATTALVDPNSGSPEGWPLLGWGAVQDAISQLVEWWAILTLISVKNKIKKEEEDAKLLKEDDNLTDVHNDNGDSNV